MRRFSFRPGLDIRGRKFKWFRGFAGKPFHPPLTDVTIGAYFIGPLLGLIAYLFKDSSWGEDVHKAAGHVILLGAISSVATMGTGWADWFNTEKGTQIRRMANAHAWTMIVTGVVVLISLWYRHFAEGGEYYSQVDLTSVVLNLVILGLVTIGGTLGGSLTYDWGFNVEIATDNPVYHQSEHDIIHPHDPAPTDAGP